ncbi:MAG: hypothetical protein ACI8TF_000523 [Paracoccaceae bacterium]|jgi:hypothetical protein
MMNRSDLDAQLLAAHDARDAPALIQLYTLASEVASDPVAIGFYLTHAYVFALEKGAPEATQLRDRLIAMGREEPLSHP